MSVEKGNIAPDLVVYIDTPPSRVVGQHSVSSLFDDGAFQQAIHDLYAQPSIWAGTQVIQHTTRESKWESFKALTHSLVKEGQVMTLSKTWNYLWEGPGVCRVCSVSYDIQDELQRCHGCLETVHHHCLMEDWRAERLPICCACGEVGHASDPFPPLSPPSEDPPDEEEQGLIPVEPDTLDPEMSEDFHKEQGLLHVHYMVWITYQGIPRANTVKEHLALCIDI